MFAITIKPFGSHAILIEWPQEIKEKILDDILAFEAHLKNNCLDVNLWELVPSYNSITLINRHEHVHYELISIELKKWYKSKRSQVKTQRQLWRLPVCYDEEFGIDLQEVAETLNKSANEIIEDHTANIYTVYGIGFLPGFMYLGGLPSHLNVPRRSTPRLKVKKGSVGLAGKQTGIYPQTSPGGWNIIGNCSVELFNPQEENPCFVKVGDKVQFYAIEIAEYKLHKIEAEVGIYKHEKSDWNA